MSYSLMSLARQGFNSLLAPVHFELVRKTHDWEDFEQFLPFEQTVEGAKSAGLALGDYIDTRYNVPGATQQTIEWIGALGVFGGRIERVCEIGAGSGRYLQKILLACNPSHYEVYETAPRWAQYLADTYPIVLRRTDGFSLSQTDSESIDLVHAHKVFVCTPSITTCRYFDEMVRVLRPGGWVAFDIVTEACLDDDTLKRWMAQAATRSPYPAIVPKRFAIDFFHRRGLSFVGSLVVPMKPGKTESMVFRKEFLSGPDEHP